MHSNRLLNFLLFGFLLLLGCSSRSASSIESVSVLWTYEPPERGAIAATPTVRDDAVFVVTIHDAGFHSLGTLRSLALATGKLRWKFDEENEMRHGISSPAIGEQTVFVGEGMHANHFCHLYAIDSTTGKKLWKFRAQGHLESSPVCFSDTVIFGAGDDGVYSLNATTGQSNWQVQGSIHIDSRPEVNEKYVYVGSGVSRAFREPKMLCLDRLKGTRIWEVPAHLPVWGSPRLDREMVFFGLGNGRLNQSASGSEKPSGSVIALEAETGKQVWRFDVPDAVLSRPNASGERVYFTSRDQHLYCLNRADGSLIWKQSLGSPIVTDPAIVGDRVYVVSTAGRVGCYNKTDGKEHWRFEVGSHSGMGAIVFSSPIVVQEPGRPNRILFGTELKNGGNSAAVLYCLQESSPTRS